MAQLQGGRRRPDYTLKWPEKYHDFDKSGSGASGLSPVPTEFPRTGGGLGGPRLSVVDEASNVSRENYQRRLLWGFTARELVNLDVITTRNLKRGDLPTLIHPLFAKNHWIGAPDLPHFTNQRYELPQGQNLSGYWEAENPLVWNVMLPSLSIATQIILCTLSPSSSETAHMNWILGLVDGPTSPIDDSRKQDADKKEFLVSYEYLSRNVTSMDRSAACQKLNNIVLAMSGDGSGRLVLGIKNGDVDPFDGKKDKALGAAVAVTHLDTVTRRIDIKFDVALILPLMRNDLTDCERMATELRLAMVMFHELAHAIEYAVYVYKLDAYQATSSLINTTPVSSPGLVIPQTPSPQPPPTPSRFSLGKSQGLPSAPPHGVSSFERYYRDDAIAECGYTMECEVFGGIIDSMYQNNMHIAQPVLWHCLADDDQTIRQIARTDGPILKNPLLADYQNCYPIKASFYEQIQQQEYWTVGVRANSGCIPTIASRREISFGIDYKCDSFTNNILKGNISDEQQFRNAYLKTSADVFDATKELNAVREDIRVRGYAMSPDERRQAHFKFNFAKNAVWDDFFWDKTQELKEYKEEVMDLIDTAGILASQTTDPEKRNMFDRLYGAVEQASSYHAQLIQVLLLMENSQNNRFEDRRDDLTFWNRGHRVYAKTLIRYAEFSPELGYVPRFQAVGESLDVCRMLLWHPGETTSILAGTTSETRSLARLDDLRNRGQWADFTRGAGEFLSRDDCSMYAVACLQVMRSQVPGQTISDSWDLAMTGFGMLQRLGDQLADVADAGPVAILNWGASLDKYKFMAVNTRAVLFGMVRQPGATPQSII